MPQDVDAVLWQIVEDARRATAADAVAESAPDAEAPDFDLDKSLRESLGDLFPKAPPSLPSPSARSAPADSTNGFDLDKVLREALPDLMPPAPQSSGSEVRESFDAFAVIGNLASQAHAKGDEDQAADDAAARGIVEHWTRGLTGRSGQVAS